MSSAGQKQARRKVSPSVTKQKKVALKEGAVSREVAPLTARIAAVIKRIPKGKVASYGLIAAMAGSPGAARQVVWTLNSQWRDERLPWQRLINSKGRIALPSGGGFELQKALLEKEGVVVSDDGAIDLDRFLWRSQTRVKK